MNTNKEIERALAYHFNMKFNPILSLLGFSVYSFFTDNRVVISYINEEHLMVSAVDEDLLEDIKQVITDIKQIGPCLSYEYNSPKHNYYIPAYEWYEGDLEQRIDEIREINKQKPRYYVNLRVIDENKLLLSNQRKDKVFIK